MMLSFHTIYAWWKRFRKCLEKKNKENTVKKHIQVIVLEWCDYWWKYEIDAIRVIQVIETSADENKTKCLMGESDRMKMYPPF